MSFSLKIQLFPNNNHKLIEIEPNWWDKDLLLKKYPFICKTDNIYTDYLLDINHILLAKIHKSQLKYLNSGVYKCSDWQKILKPIVRKIDRIIESKKEFKIIRILIYEWESGY